MSIVENRKAFHDYFVEERYEAGLVLEGWEVKAIRAGRAQIGDAYVIVGGDTYCLGALSALQAAGKASHADVVSLLFTNVVGVKPSAAQAQPFIDLLENGMSIGALTVFAAEYELNTANIGLTGLVQTGIEFVPFG